MRVLLAPGAGVFAGEEGEEKMYKMGDVIGQKNFHYWALAGIAMELGIPLKTDKYSYDEHELEDLIRARVREGKAKKMEMDKTIKNLQERLADLQQANLFDIQKYSFQS
jgi:hypothetical protein